MTALAALYAEFEKAGLITPGRRPLHQRIAFLLSTATGSGRRSKIGQYLETRKRGRAIPGTRKPRRGTYTGVYATGVNKSESVMSDVIDDLYDTIEKAKGLLPRGGTPKAYARLAGMRAKKPNGAKAGRQGKAMSYLMHRRRRELGLDRKMAR